MKNISCFNFSKYIALSLVFGCLLTSGFGQSKKNTRPKNTKEQTSFSSEGATLNAVKLPSNVLEQLAAYDGGRLAECQKDDLTRQKSVAAHFAAAAINFNDDRQPDLIVQAKTLCFMGAHNTTFWIFTALSEKTNPKYKLVFDIPADYLKVLPTATNKMRDLETASHTAIELYTIRWKFDGEVYRQSECTVTGTDDKAKKVECSR